MKQFDQVLRKLRAGAGYSSSRAFYNDLGGRAFFGCTYRQFLNVESGQSLPGAKLLEKIAAGLGLGRRRENAREFVLAYLNSLTGSKDVVHMISVALAEAPADMGKGQSPLVKSMARTSEKNQRNYTKAESQLVMAAPENYWAFQVLAHDKGHWTAAKIAETTGIPLKDIQNGLQRLSKTKLISKDKTGKYFCPEAGKVFLHPSDGIYGGGAAKIGEYREAMIDKRGERLLKLSFSSRASEAELRQYFPFLIDGVMGAEVCSNEEGGEDSILFEISTKISKIFPL
jgi:hypothetical protein